MNDHVCLHPGRKVTLIEARKRILETKVTWVVWVKHFEPFVSLRVVPMKFAIASEPVMLVVVVGS
jgi:hypothetical protein